MGFDERLIGALHVDWVGEDDLAAAEAGGVFQASTITALLEGAYEGDVSFAELAARGDLGLGTLNGIDGEMIALDGRFYRAGVDGDLTAVPPEAKTPFAVLVRFHAVHHFELSAQPTLDALGAAIDFEVGHPERVHALRIDGRFDRVHARSVPKQSPPYRPLAEVVAEQHVFDFTDAEGTMVGFRFPDREEGLNAPGYHLHFATADRTRGGHVLDCSLRSASVQVDDETGVQLELPPGVVLGAGGDEAALRRVERED